MIHHSDCGSQYASGAYRAELAARGMIASMSGKGNCYDNAVAESVFSTLEFELLMQSDWHTREEARHSIANRAATAHRAGGDLEGQISLPESFFAPLSEPDAERWHRRG